MTGETKILIIEDNLFDADLLRRELKKSGLIFTSEIVQTRVEFEKALHGFNPDIILADYSLPSFDAVTAFHIKQKTHPQIPFIIISGVIGEQNAVDLIKNGVTDYASKDKLFTINNKISRALNDLETIREKVIIDEQLKIQSAKLIEANKELVFQNEEKEKRAAELIIANKELVFQNEEKEKRAEELVILSVDLQEQQKELRQANKNLVKQEENVKIINRKLSQLNLELTNRTMALAESEASFRNMMETIPQIAWTNTVSGKVTFFNLTWYSYTGIDVTKATTNGWQNYIHNDDLQIFTDRYKSIHEISKGGEFQIRVKRADGNYRWHLIRLMPIKKENGEVRLWIGTATDIEDLRLLQQQKDDFISIASHELKTPVTSLKASLQLLNKIKNNAPSAMLPVLIERANKSVNKITALIDSFLNASKVNEGQIHLNQKIIVLSELIKESCRSLTEAGNYNITIKGDSNIEAYADADRIEQVVINFINNAIKYAPKSKEILISIEQISGIVRVSVTDYGPGISPEKLPYLFDRYFRADSSGSQYSGLGLGLYISAEIIKKHNGQIGVDSELNKGSTFWFEFPLSNVIKIGSVKHIA
jgi:PAS domain S-box-containing protein